MSLFKKKRDENYFYQYLMDLTPGEMIAFQKAVVRYMSEIQKLYADVNVPKESKDRKEVQ